MKLKPILIALCLLMSAQFGVFAQLTIRLSNIPTNTPANDILYVAGTLNNWSPNGTALAKDSLGIWTVTVNPPTGLIEYKCTRGSWATVEGNANGGFRPNRTYQYNGQPSTLVLDVLTWEDLGPSGGTVTSEEGVYIVNNSFFMPQLNRNRRVWIYLPPDYNSTVKRYPVLYMQDGQNLFDPNTSFSGEWQIDETLNTLHSQGDYGCIVVGIDNGGASRIDEYSPWVNPQYGGGEADEYLDFIVSTLKPHIDQNYRTLPGRTTTGIGGSSMGALFAQYALIEKQDIFSKAAIFSPAFWFAGNASANHVTTTGKDAEVRTFFLAGGSEPASVNTNMNTVADAMINVGFLQTEQQRLVVPGGQHSEWFWAQEFGDAYQWLFANSVSTVEFLPDAQNRGWRISPNPSAGTDIRLWPPAHFNATKSIGYQVVSVGTGRVVADSTVAADAPLIPVQNMPAGHYIIRLDNGVTLRFIKTK
jgi:predicted alpha/beta superfamily hydrolase